MLPAGLKVRFQRTACILAVLRQRKDNQSLLWTSAAMIAGSEGPPQSRQSLPDRNVRRTSQRKAGCRVCQVALDWLSLLAQLGWLNRETICDMKTRPRTKLVLKRKNRRCPKC